MSNKVSRVGRKSQVAKRIAKNKNLSPKRTAAGLKSIKRKRFI